MIDNEQQIDHAEHAAQTAEQEAERASEQAHEHLLSAYVRDLRTLARTARLDAHASIERLADEVNLRQAPNVHRYELLMRQQHVAVLAATAAAALERPLGTYDLVSVVEGVADAYLVQQSTGRDDLPGRACRHAAGRVVDTVKQTAREDADRFADDHADAIVEDERREDGTYGHVEAFGSEL